MLTEEEKSLIEILSDPIKWAEHTLKSKEGNFKARSYQKEIVAQLMNTSDHRCNRVVLRWGRRLGKPRSVQHSFYGMSSRIKTPR